MADKSIGELVAATAVGSTDLFVLEQNSTAKKLTGQILENWLVSMADGHGGIQTIALTSTSGLVDTYTITMADATTTTFTVTNGKAISSITQYWAVSTSNSSVPSSWSTTRQTMTATNKYLWSYMRITYNDSTYTDTTKSVVGVYGDTGLTWYTHIKYAGAEPTSDSDIGDEPDKWVGIYSGTASTAPTTYTSYEWYSWKGDTGDPSELSSSSVMYCVSESGTYVPTSGWSAGIPIATSGEYLWTRTVLTFNTGDPVTYYTVARQGVDGSGSPSNTLPLADTTEGAIGSSELFARADHRHPLPSASDIMTSDNTSVQTHLNNLEQYIDVIYPVGSIYMSVNSTSPATLFGGTWSRIQDTFLLAAGSTYTAGATGGEATHTLTTSEIPAHTHGSKSLSGTIGYRRGDNNGAVMASPTGIVGINENVFSGWPSSARGSASYAGDQMTIDATHEHTSVGGSGAHNNMPPYLAVYMWKRTA